MPGALRRAVKTIGGGGLKAHRKSREAKGPGIHHDFQFRTWSLPPESAEQTGPPAQDGTLTGGLLPQGRGPRSAGEGAAFRSGTMLVNTVLARPPSPDEQSDHGSYVLSH